MTNPEPPAAEDNSGLVAIIQRVPLLRVLLSSAGTIGVLVGIGYLADAAQHNLLGVKLEEHHGATDYAVIGGGFFADILRVTWRHGLIAAVMIALIFIAAFVAETMRTKIATHWPRLPWMAGFVIVILAYSLKSVWLDLPYIRMSNLLSAPPICKGAGLPDQRDHEAWLRLICARRDTNLVAALQRQNIACAEDFAWSAWRQSKRGIVMAARYSRLSIEQEFTINLFVSGFLAYCSLLLYTARSETRLSALAQNVLRAITLMVMAVNVLALPFIYGKVIRSTDMPSGRIMYLSLNDDLKEEPRNVVALLMSADEKFVMFYDTETNQFTEIGRGKVHWITIDRSEDLVVKRMIYFIDSSHCR